MMSILSLGGTRKAFTLIEMLIVIVIIGILASALIPRLQSVQSRARDTKRKVDLRSLSNAVEIYKVDNTDYPTLGAQFIHSTQGTSWFTGLLKYVTSLPTDPTNIGTTLFITGAYNYQYGNVSNSQNIYNLSAKLENRSDPERCELRLHLMGVTGSPRCSYTMISGYTSEVRYFIEAGPNAR